MTGLREVWSQFTEQPSVHIKKIHSHNAKAVFAYAVAVIVTMKSTSENSHNTVSWVISCFMVISYFKYSETLW